MKGSPLTYRLGDVIAHFIPRNWAYMLARAIVPIYSLFNRSDLRAVAGNLRQALPGTPEKELRRLAYATVVNFSRYLTDFFYFDRVDEVFVRNNVDIRGREHADAALRRGNGLIFASAHAGNAEFGATTLAVLGYKAHVLAIDHANAGIHSFFQMLRKRRKGDLRMLSVDLGGVRASLRALKGGGSLALSADRFFGEGGITVDYFGRKTPFARGFAVLSALTGAEVLPTFFMKEPGGRYSLEIGAPLKAKNEEGLMGEFVARLEEQVRKYPDQWFIFQPYWEKQIGPQ